MISVTQTIQDTQSKYFINGKKETMEKVKNLFCSVKLNVNNPHFLIMQGRVTKVINMKPIEVLGLIEEAAGTSFFMTKRENAESLIRRKELKLAEIENILQTEVNPKLDQLHKDKNAFDEYNQILSDIDKNERIILAFKYFDLQSSATDPSGKG